MGKKHTLEQYKIFRDYLKHEDNLINFRTGWSIFIQSVLGTGFSYRLNKLLVDKPKESLTFKQFFSTLWDLINSINPDILMLSLAIFGFIISCLTLKSVKAALNAIDTLEETSMNQHNFSQYNLPTLAGGGHKNAKDHGHNTTLWIHRILIVAWAEGIFIALTFQI